MTKLVKTLIIINGFLIPSIVLFVLGRYVWDEIRWRTGSDNRNRVNTENLLIEDSDTLIIQGIEYSRPIPIPNSTNYYIEVNAVTYDEPVSKRLFEADVHYEGGEYNYSEDLLNVIFLDKNFNPINTLFKEKGFISRITLTEEFEQRAEETDTTIHNILYLVTFKDSNKDSYLDYADDADLYISDLNGGNFKKITDGIDIVFFKFINKGKDVLISWNERSGDHLSINNYTHFAIYNIAAGKLTNLEKIDQAIRDINKTLIEK